MRRVVGWGLVAFYLVGTVGVFAHWYRQPRTTLLGFAGYWLALGVFGACALFGLATIEDDEQPVGDDWDPDLELADLIAREGE